MKEFVSKWSNWWILNPKRKQLDDAFEKELNELIEREAALRQPLVSGELADFARFLSEKYSIEIHERIIDEWNKYYSANYR